MTNLMTRKAKPRKAISSIIGRLKKAKVRP